MKAYYITYGTNGGTTWVVQVWAENYDDAYTAAECMAGKRVDVLRVSLHRLNFS